MIDSSRDYVTLFSATLIKKKIIHHNIKSSFQKYNFITFIFTALPVIKKEKKKNHTARQLQVWAAVRPPTPK